MTPKGKPSNFILWHLEVADSSSGGLSCLLGLGQVASLELARVSFSCILFLTNVHLLRRARLMNKVYQPKEKGILTSSVSLLLPNTATSSSLELLVSCGEPGHPSSCCTQQIYPIRFWDHLCLNFASSSSPLCTHMRVRARAHTHTYTCPPPATPLVKIRATETWVPNDFISQVNDIKSFVLFLFLFFFTYANVKGNRQRIGGGERKWDVL